ncbi:MAG: Mut7-C RNAse domain-containing protein [Deltaproteobacteria bacterium]|nr:Mut7-C RNAse domain-containing protein [Deltaproteobacteria bacterium]
MKQFIADAMLGKLARWMRMMGCDVEYFSEISDCALSDRAQRGNRIILTRDTRLIQRKINRDNAFLVIGDHYPDQLRQVVRAFNIDPFKDLLSRCLRCNMPLVSCNKNDLAGKIPPYVFETQDRFETCSQCRKIYWKATHVEKMVEQLRNIFGANRLPEKPAVEPLERFYDPETI